MKKILFCFIVTIHVAYVYAQTITTRLTNAYKVFESDSQLSNAISSLYVIDAKTGKVVFEKNSKIGLAPASTQKIITAATAYELLGKDFRYKTYFGYYGGSFGVLGTGDPTFGSSRYFSTRDTVIFSALTKALNEKGLHELVKFMLIDPKKSLPNSGWIYEDVGNYYGASLSSINWKENQYDIVFIPGENVGDPADIDTLLTSELFRWELINEVKTGKAGSGDNAYVYLNGDLNRKKFRVRGTIPAGVNRFRIAGSDFNPECTFAVAFQTYAKSKGMFKGETNGCAYGYYPPAGFGDSSVLNKVFYVHRSPSLDSINYWFLRKSINLYGEALINTLAFEKGREVNTENGISLLKELWKAKGIRPSEINIVDGSGLSPLNRVTTNAQVKILQYAKKQPWFPGYYDAFPEYNGMKMKSGTITGAKAFCGYHKSKTGQDYVFSFIVNNYNGSSSSLVQKMYRVLDELK
jgi:serine-type D-Ala-D-Ala carboxypeptidase/endopeptidase (penicillin-binding protein 4)